ncbi:3-isopropylmalate dehydratase large subunit [Ponticaulis profundi]|uniref:3-isopropylmalate dehydratase n=1 Tax=Ponticaulis profundi TaxID=2665222 RepID=A0ABW1S7Q0_9PROT
MGKTIFEKIWDMHRVAEIGGGTDLVLIDRILLHERTGGVALKSLEASGRAPNDPSQIFATMDHIVDTLPGRNDNTLMPTGRDFIVTTREAAKAAGITLFDLNDARQGIVHVISPELGIILPGATLVCPDSHTCSQGALGGLAWGIGSSEAEHAVATSTLRVSKPKTMRISVDGELAPGVTAKDLALYIISEIGSSGARGHIVEYAGSAVRDLEVEGRLTLCNMATELAAFSAIIAPDEKVFEYLKDRPYAPKGEDWDKAIASWQTLASDEDAEYDIDIALAAEDITPMISWGVSPQQTAPINAPVPQFKAVSHRDSKEIYSRALSYMDLKAGKPLNTLTIDAAFIGSCTNSRLSDLRRAAKILKGRKVADHVKAICVPGSTTVKAQAEAEGLDQVFRDAGFEWRESGCSMCFFAGGESFGAEERVVTSTNRNFESRQGPKTRSHLASPETVAASAIMGRITDPRLFANGDPA